MRRLTAISFLLVLLFNLFGYRLYFNYMEQRETVRLEQRLDREQYDESQLIEIRIPLNLPYGSNWDDFERFDGEVEVAGIHYKYVKRRVFNDSLILLCIPDEARMQLRTARDDFFSLANDLQADKGKKQDNQKPLTLKPSLGDYDANEVGWSIEDALASAHLHHISYQQDLEFPTIDEPAMPPEQILS